MSKVKIELNRAGAQTRAVVEVRGDDGKNGLLKSMSKKR